MNASTRIPSIGWLTSLVRLHRRLHPPLPWLAILGPDGSGKSTLVAGIRDAWPACVRVYHLRPERLNRPGRAIGPVVDPHGKPPRGAVLSAVALMFVIMDWWLGYWTSIARHRARGDLVVFDRHLMDVLVDPRRYRYGGPLWLARAACAVVPRPNLIVILDAPPAVVRERKQEVSEAELHRQLAAYRHIAGVTPGAQLVDAAMPAKNVLEAVLTMLRPHTGPGANSG
jgi:thymidylate kinase